MGQTSSETIEVANTVMNKLETRMETTNIREIQNLSETSNINISESTMETAIKVANDVNMSSVAAEEQKVLLDIQQNTQQVNTISITNMSLTNSTVDFRAINQNLSNIASTIKSMTTPTSHLSATVQVAVEAITETMQKGSNTLTDAQERAFTAALDSVANVAAANTTEQKQSDSKESDALNGAIDALADVASSIVGIGSTSSKSEKTSNCVSNMTSIASIVTNKYSELNNHKTLNRIENITRQCYSLGQDTQIRNIAEMTVKRIIRQCLFNAARAVNEAKIKDVQMRGSTLSLFLVNLNTSVIVQEAIYEFESSLSNNYDSSTVSAISSVMKAEVSNQMDRASSITDMTRISSELVASITSDTKQTLEKSDVKKGTGVEGIVSSFTSMGAIIGIVAIIAVVGGGGLFLYFMLRSPKQPQRSSGGYRSYTL